MLIPQQAKSSLKALAISAALTSLVASTHCFAQQGFYGQLDGQIITTQNITELKSATGFTFETQVYVNELSTWTTLMGQADSSTNRILLQMNQGKLYCIVADGSNTFKYTDTPVLEAKKWHNIAMTYDSNSSNQLTLYVDGVAQNLATGWKGSPSGNAPDVTANFVVGSGKYDGLIDNVRVWNSALSASTLNQWQDKALNASHPNAPSLALNWEFEDYNSANSVAAGVSTLYSGNVVNLNYERQFIGSYFPHYKLNNLEAETARNVSHIFYFSLAPDVNGELGRVDSQGTFTPIDNIAKVPVDIALLDNWRASYNTELFVVVGGWVQSDYMDEALANPTSRANLIANIKTFLQQYNLDGVDIDWEGYHGSVNALHYSLFLQEMKASFAGTDFKIATTIKATAYGHAPAFEQYTDFVQLMTYIGNVNTGGTSHALSTIKPKIQGWVNAGLSKEKIVVGFAANGKAANSSVTPSILTYSDIISTYDPAPSVDSVAHNGTTYYFNGVDTIADKAEYVKKQGLKGIMMWEQAQDVGPLHPKSLIGSAAKTIGLNNQIDQ